MSNRALSLLSDCAVEINAEPIGVNVAALARMHERIAIIGDSDGKGKAKSPRVVTPKRAELVSPKAATPLAAKAKANNSSGGGSTSTATSVSVGSADRLSPSAVTDESKLQIAPASTAVDVVESAALQQASAATPEPVAVDAVHASNADVDATAEPSLAAADVSPVSVEADVAAVVSDLVGAVLADSPPVAVVSSPDACAVVTVPDVVDTPSEDDVPQTVAVTALASDVATVDNALVEEPVVVEEAAVVVEEAAVVVVEAAVVVEEAAVVVEEAAVFAEEAPAALFVVEAEVTVDAAAVAVEVASVTVEAPVAIEQAAVAVEVAAGAGDIAVEAAGAATLAAAVHDAPARASPPTLPSSSPTTGVTRGVLIRGMLNKREGGAFGKKAATKARFVRLEDGVVEYYADAGGKKLGELELGVGATVTAGVDGWFTVTSPTTAAPLELEADSDSAKEEWIRLIQSTIDTAADPGKRQHSTARGLRAWYSWTRGVEWWGVVGNRGLTCAVKLTLLL